MRLGGTRAAVRLAALATTVGLLSGCFYLLGRSEGGGQAAFTPPREVRATDIQVPPGYQVEVVASGLTFPTDAAFDEQGRVYVLEAGYSYGPKELTPRLLRVDPGGKLTEIAKGPGTPWNGAVYYQGAFYISEGGSPGRLIRIGRDGTRTVLVDGLPSKGDHHTNGPAIGPDGWIYFSQGTITNSGVVGMDNYKFGWLKDRPQLHDVPGADIVLKGRNFTTENPLTPDPKDKATTGAFVPFGQATQEGQVIKGQTKSSGSVLRVRPDGSGLELVAWGFRNPFGVAFSPEGKLFVTENGYDIRGSRPVFETPDYLWEVKRGLWHGWPDFVGGIPITDRRFAIPFGSQPEFLLAKHPNVPPKPVVGLGVHSSSNGLSFSRSDRFGYVGQAFIAQFGDMVPSTGKVLEPVGFKVIRVDVASKSVVDFMANKGSRNGPASKIGGAGLERPVAARFDPSGENLYVVDFGVMTMEGDSAKPREGTGVVWRIRRTP